MTSQHKSIYYLGVLTLVGVMLLSFLWEFFLEDLIVPHVYKYYHPEPLYERWEYIIVSAFLTTIAIIIPSRLALHSLKEADHARAVLATAYDDLDKRVQERTYELANTNKKLKTAMAERLEYEESLRKSEKELRLLSSQLLTAQEKERRRIALDLHDNVTQALVALKLKIEHAMVEVDTDDKKMAELEQRLLPIVQDSIEEVRSMYMRLRPSILDDLGLTATLTWLWRDFQDTNPDIHIHREINIVDSEIPDSLKIIIFRVIQEALNNIVRHSKADQVEVTLSKENDSVELVVQDNGIGFSIEDVLSVDDSLRGMGLSSMKERVELTEGKLTINSGSGEGTQVIASWPIIHDQSL